MICRQKYNLFGFDLGLSEHEIGNLSPADVEIHTRSHKSDEAKKICVLHHCLDDFQVWIHETIESGKVQS